MVFTLPYLTLKFYRLPRDAKIQCEYKKILKTEGINWKSGHICCEHWSEGMEKDNNDLPNLTVPSTQIPIIEKIYQKAKERYGKLKLPTNTDKLKLKELKRKLYKMPTCTSTKRKEPTSRSTSSTLKNASIHFPHTQVFTRAI